MRSRFCLNPSRKYQDEEGIARPTIKKLVEKISTSFLGEVKAI
jgi:hypothetical protein